MRPLQGLRVIDFTTLLPGPLATLLLAEAGAEVIKIEKPGGEDMRRYPPLVGGTSASFALLNRGKRSIEIDLKDTSARDALIALVDTADILVEQFRPGVMTRLGLGYEALAEINPGLIYCAITGYGQRGPRALEAGHDMNYIGNTGLLALSHGTAEAPVVPPALVADIGGGSFPAFSNILRALIARGRSGRGAFLDIAMADAAFTFAVFAQADLAAGGEGPASGEGLLTGGSPRYRLYPTGDGHLVAVAALEQKFWDALCTALEIESIKRDDRREPLAAGNAIAGAIGARSAAELRPILAAADCCATIVESLDDAMRDPHFRARGLFDHTVTAAGAHLPAAVVPIDPAYRGEATSLAAPALGADNSLLAARMDDNISGDTSTR